MNHYWETLRQDKKTSFLISLCMIVASAFLQVFVMQVFMNPCNLISGGFTGIALFINRIAERFGVELSTSLLIILLNAPVAAICYRAVSKRFVKLSIVQFVLVSLLLEVCNFHPLFYDVIVNLLFGGLLWGTSIALALLAGGSTGGTDFIAQYVANKIHRSIFEYVFYFNCLMYLGYGASFGWLYCAYSIIFQFLSTTAINKLYQRYQRVTLEITCKDPDEITHVFMQNVRHGMSIIECRGAYKGEKYYICKSTVSKNELSKVCHELRKADPRCLINVYQSIGFYGNFYQKPLE
jgi:uncharacterized membrane-anchored protein YitT (DUF2179 family)